jgi:hypothetical protein
VSWRVEVPSIWFQSTPIRQRPNPLDGNLLVYPHRSLDFVVYEGDGDMPEILRQFVDGGQ